MELVVPALPYLASYTDALQRGWSPDNVRLAEAAREQLAEIAADPAAFVASLDGRDPKGGLVTFPDGSKKPRLPGYRLWMWDGEFCGSIGFRWQTGTSALPPYVLGHIGYAVVPWKRRLGHATRALALMLDEARHVGLTYVELTTDPANDVSQKVITATAVCTWSASAPLPSMATGKSYAGVFRFSFRDRGIPFCHPERSEGSSVPTRALQN